jgi:uncharacterized heparinase superfamily protein
LGEHDGYRRLSGRNVHRRRWTLNSNELLIEDHIEGPFRSAKCYFHLHPGIEVRHASGSELQLSDSRGVLCEVRFGGAAIIDIADTHWHPGFGVALPSQCIVAQLGGPRMTTLVRGVDRT